MKKIFFLSMLLLLALPALAHEDIDITKGGIAKCGAPLITQNDTMMGGQQGMYGMMGGFSPWWMLGGFGVGLGAIVMFAFWGLLLVLLIGLVRWVWKQGSEKK